MDTAQIRREFGSALSLLAREERRLLGGAVLVVLGYAVWVGATGAAINYGTDFAGEPLSVSTWSSTTTAVFALVTLLWVVVPAAVVTRLVDGAITNSSGNIASQYRVHHPFVLVAPFLLLALLITAAGIGAGTFPTPLFGVVAALGLFALVRTVAASYRAFSFSHPLLVKAFLFLALSVTAIATLAGAATVADREAFVEDAAAGIADLLGFGSVETFLVGETVVNGVTIPYLLAAAAGVPAGLTLVYVVVQLLVAGVQRYQRPDVPRADLRTGQRYPDFARPVSESTPTDISKQSSAGASDTGSSSSTSSSASPTSSSGSSPSTASSSASSSGTTASATGTGDTDTGTDDDEDEEEEDDQEVEKADHTKVFTPPDDVDGVGIDDGPSAGGAMTGTTSTDDSDESGYRCPSCDDRFGPDASFEYCPTCGSELEEE